MRCPSFERLLDYLDGKLAADEAAPLAAHLATDCQRCAASRQWYLEVRAVAAGDDTLAPPAWVMKRALRIFETQSPRLIERVKEAIRETIASLVFDSLSRPALTGVRSTETANRQLLYRADDYHIDLQVAPAGQARVKLTGQVLREGETTFESVSNLGVEILLGDKKQYEAVTSAMGEFVIADLKPGEYDVRVETREGGITAVDVPVRPPE